MFKCVIKLFVAQGDHGIDAHGAARGDVTRGERDDHEQQCDDGERQRIGSGDPVEHSGHEAREGERGGDSDGDAE